MTDATPTPEVEETPGASQSEAERVDTPYVPFDPFDMPETTWRVNRGPRGSTILSSPIQDLYEFRDRLPEILTKFPADSYAALSAPDRSLPRTEEEIDAELRQEQILSLHWCGPTAHSEERVQACEQAIQGYADKSAATGKTVNPPPALLRELAVWTEKRRKSRWRDALLAARRAVDPDCWCLGLGGKRPVAVVIKSLNPEETVPYRDDAGGMTWGLFCDCEIGAACRQDAAAQADAMRERARVAHGRRILGAARIPAEYADYTLATYPDRDAARKVEGWYLYHLGELAAPPSRTLRPWLMLHGPNRRGKTGLAMGVLKLALARGIPGIFRTLADLLDELRATFDKNNPACHAEVMQALKDAPLLILDDLGAERIAGGETWVAETIYSLLNARHLEKRLTILTTNLGWVETPAVTARWQKLGNADWLPEDWDPEELLTYLGERIWWRVEHSSDRLRLLGPILGLDEDTPAAPAEDPEIW